PRCAWFLFWPWWSCLALVGIVGELAHQRVELELAELALVDEELLAHLVGRLAHLRGGKVQFRGLSGELHLAGAVQPPEADEGLGDGLAEGEQAVVAQDDGLILRAQARL